ncbi:hypothetical protein [Pelagibaculum spongiae]|uniref:hypothetical protein n=1 Tax=Pelagibaculum spongiae TaxID=2080658 RepID=UPI0010583129|nr:hypothetical protein [Pelagibaculum spongiae]
MSSQLIRANFSYFIVWIMAYWFAITSRKMITNSIIGFFAVILSPSIMPLVGYILLIVMYKIRRIKVNPIKKTANK